MNSKSKQTLALKKQKGAVLIIAMMLLLILTVLGVSVMENSVVEERLASNAFDRNIAFQAAEAALREAEEWIQSQAAMPPNTVAFAGSGSQIADLNMASWWDGYDDNWLDGNEVHIVDIPNEWEVDDTILDHAQPPAYKVEFYNSVCPITADVQEGDCRYVFRITAKGWGERESTQVVLQTMYARR